MEETDDPALAPVPRPRDGATGGRRFATGPSAEILLNVWQHVAIPMAVLDTDCRIALANPAAQDRLAEWALSVGDRLPLELLGTGAADADGPPLAGQHPVNRALNGQGPSGAEVVLPRKFGLADQAMRISAHPLPLEDGACGALLVFQDVTEQHRRNEEARLTISRLTTLLDGASDYAILLLDPQGRVMSWSTSAERLKGWTAEQIVGFSYGTFFLEEDRAAGAPARILAEAARTGRAETDGIRVRRDGSTFLARGVVTALFDEDDGELLGFVKVTHDVTRDRQREREVTVLNEQLSQRTAQLEKQAAALAAVNSELEAFSYSVSHDLRAPLRTMNGFAHILAEDYASEMSPEGRRYLDRIQNSATQMAGLIDAILSLSKMQRQDLRAERLDMEAIVDRCWQLLAPAREGRHIDLVRGDLPCARGDERLIQQVWTNLLENAIKYTSAQEAARVEVGCQTGDGELRFYVRDDGVGFDMAHAEKLFHVFQRLHRAEDYPGVGVGLALVQRILQRHGGTIRAESAPGQGATFSFSLPEHSAGER